NLTLAVCVLVFGADALVGQRARRGDDRVEDRGTVIAIYTLQLAALALAVLFAYRAPATAVPGDPWIPVIVGVVLMVGGMAFRVSAILTLGPLFTRQVMVRRGHRVVADGPYRWLRHPSSSGALLPS